MSRAPILLARSTWAPHNGQMAPPMNLSTDLVCFSHLRWDFVYQRPQHLMTRFAKHRRVFYIEEPVDDSTEGAWLEIMIRAGNITRVIPHLEPGTDRISANQQQASLFKNYFRAQQIDRATFWYYTPMAIPFSMDLMPSRVIYDCMDELAAFKNAPPQLRGYERELIARADHVFTGGHSLYHAKRNMHPSIHPFPSSIDVEHFAQGRRQHPEPEDLQAIAHPRVGFYGVIDERADLELIAEAAERLPEWQFVMVGPVVNKVDESSLPRLGNIHYLGAKSYDELPVYLSHWDVAMVPFALNESTRFISPTKTPEYLAAGKPVVSTPIRDVVRPYGEKGFVNIATSPQDFVAKLHAALQQTDDAEWLQRVDQYLAGCSWNLTWQGMAALEAQAEDALESQSIVLFG